MPMTFLKVVQRLWNFVKRHRPLIQLGRVEQKFRKHSSIIDDRKKLIASGIIAGGIWYALRAETPVVVSDGCFLEQGPPQRVP